MKNLSPKEAITILEGMRIDIPVPKAAVTQIKRNLALDMAINALNCSEIPNSSDTISRQQAIDTAIDAVDNWDGGCNKHREQIIRGALEILPSVQPEQRWIPVTKEEVFKAGYEGREIRFRVDGRLFAIRELAQ